MSTSHQPHDTSRKLNDTCSPFEGKYRETLDTMGDAIHVVDSDLVVLSMNDRFRTWIKELGLEIDSPIGKTVFELFPYLPGKVKEEYRQVFDTGQVLTTLDTSKTPAGDLTTETLKIPVCNASQVIQVVTVIRDITKQEQINRDSKANEERLRLLFETVPHAVYECDQNGFITLTNSAYTQIVGYSKDELVGMHVKELMVPGQQKDGLVDYLEMLVKEQPTPTPYIAKNQKKDGSLIDVEIHWNYQHNEQGCVTDFVCILSDITGRKKIESALRASQQEYQMIFDSINDLVLVHYPSQEGNPVRFEAVNDIACQSLGYSREELLQLSPEHIIAPEKRGDLTHLVEKAFVERNFLFETEFITKDGRIFPVEISSHLFDYDGRPVLVCNARDMTARKEAEEKLDKAKKKAEADSRAKSQFLVNMSHEIRTPMSVIMGFIDLIKQEDMSEEKALLLESLCRAGHSLVRIADDILDVSKIEAGKLPIDATECSIRHLLTNAEAMIRPQAETRNLEFSVACDDDVPATITTDGDRVLQCLLNIAGNAVKFTGQGYIHLTVSLHGVNGVQWIHFDCEDTGIGIAPDKLDSIFELFMQIDTGKTRQYDGVGLGLAIARQLARLLGGSLTATSKLGVGSVFTLAIPVRQEVVADLDRPMELRPHAARRFGGKVLLVDDYEGIRKVLRRMLERLGLKVTLAENGREAIECAISHTFDIIFMDIQMPVLDGYSATRELRAKGVATPIIALTAHAMDIDRQACLDVGCHDYLSKPIDHNELLRVLGQHCPETPRV